MTFSTTKRTCPLCLARVERREVRGADGRQYCVCGRCWLIAAEKAHHLPWELEGASLLARDGDDAPRLEPLMEVLRSLLPQGARGLDFFCGPKPVFSQRLLQQGVACEFYDPIFCDVPLTPPYEVVIAAGCASRWPYPTPEFRRITHLLRPGGCLVVESKYWTDLDSFSRWDYTRDPTHVSYFHERSMEFICGKFGFSPVFANVQGMRVLQSDMDAAR